jgi:glutathione synthase/RimK-type ligase-like ATP-grasp enzyme
MRSRAILLTLAEDTAASTAAHFAVLHRVDEHDCLHFAAALRARAHAVWYVNWRDIDLHTRRLARAFHSNAGRFEQDVPLTRFDLAFVYKMEGFLLDQPRFLAMVKAFEQSCATVVNAPATIRSNIDKSYLFQLAGHGIAVIPSWRMGSDPDAATANDPVAALLAAGYFAIVKPLRAERGRGIVRLDPAQGEAARHAALSGVDPITHFVQRYEPAIRDGERSLAFLGHAFQHAVIKFPNPADPAEFRCNESLGGKVSPYAPTRDELDFAARVLRTSESLGWPVRFSRIDLVVAQDGPVLMEAELLNPSIYANYVGRGAEFGEALAAYFEMLMR